MATVRSVMTEKPICVQTDDIALQVAKIMTENNLGAVPICGKDNRLKGVVTDRDLVRKVFAQGREKSFPAGDLNQHEAVTVGADDSVAEAVATMAAHRLKRLPVIDGTRLVGMVSLADLARVLPDDELASLVRVLSSDEPVTPSAGEAAASA